LRSGAASQRNDETSGESVADMVVGGPKNEKLDTIFAIWLIRDSDRNILFDSGFHRAQSFKRWKITSPRALDLVNSQGPYTRRYHNRLYTKLVCHIP
jgi:hypothetical protein